MVGHFIRGANMADRLELQNLYSLIAKSGSIARRPEEVTTKFITGLIVATSELGLMLIIENEKTGEIEALIHATYGEIEDLRHVLGQLTLIVRPDLQGRGLGKALFSEFLNQVRSHFKFIYRVELRARASNLKALQLYESLGFEREGLFRSRIQTRDGDLEDGIPMVWFNPNWASQSAENSNSNSSGRPIPCG